MCDGDKLLVIKDRLLTKVAKRNMQGIVPLYYEMKKAKGNLINNETLYDGMIQAYTTGNIGPISNNITKIWNCGKVEQEQVDVIRWLCMENNYVIDAAKTLYTPTRPKEIHNIISYYTKAKVPDFFQYAKDKLPSQVELPNQSTMNKIASKIPDSKINFLKSISKFDYRMLMNLDWDFSISSESPVVKAYDEMNLRKKEFTLDDENIKGQNLYELKKIRKYIIEKSNKDIDYIVNTLVAFLYTARKTSSKKRLWDCFGDIILKNLKNNLIGKGNICQICGKRFIPKRIDQVTCSCDCAKKLDNQNRQLRRSLYNK